MLPYDQYLKRFPAYLQQLTMESNGKHVTLDGAHVDYETGPVYWGEPGTNGQHSFYQLIHQGTELVPVDLIGFADSLNPLGDHHDMLTANVFAQAKALAFGKTLEEVLEPRAPPGGRAAPGDGGQPPQHHAASPRCSRRAVLGSLVALYEHSVFTQGVDLGHRLLRPVGRRARQGDGARDRARSSPRPTSPRSTTTRPPTP